jgi:hypothetical protein
VFCVNIGDIATGPLLVDAMRSAAPYCGLLLRSNSDPCGAGPWPEETVCKLKPELNARQPREIVGLYNALTIVVQH